MPQDSAQIDHNVDASGLRLPPNSILPNYTGNGIVNLMSSIATAFGVQSDWANAKLLDDRPLGRRVVLLVIDGLGIDHLLNGLPNGFLASHCIGNLTSVSPSATAAAIPVFLTGEPPAVHGFPGWFTWFEELSCTAAILPYAARAGFVSLSRCAVSPNQLSGVKVLSTKIQAPSWVISPKAIAHSTFSENFRGNSTIQAFDTIENLIGTVHKTCKKMRDTGYVYTYWSDYDQTAHGYGVHSDEAQNHLEMLDEKVEKLANKLKGMDIDLIVSADHGFTDCPFDKQFILEQDFPELKSMLKMPLTGEPRLATAHVKHGAIEGFVEYANDALEGVATVVESEHYINAGMLGGKKHHDQLLNRMGDAVLLMHPNTVIFDPLKGETAPVLIGNHGGLSPEEMLVPLIHHKC